MLVFVDGGDPRRTADGGGGFGGAQPAAASILAEFRGWLGRVTVARDAARDQGVRRRTAGTVLTIGSSTVLGQHLGLPIASALVGADGRRRRNGRCRARSSTFPGSILESRIDTAHPLAYGMDDRAMVMWDESPAFRLQPEASLEGVKPIAWFDNPTPLRSGWAWGQHYLDQAVSIRRSAGRKGTRRAVRAGSPLARAAARDVQAVLQRACTTAVLLSSDRATVAIPRCAL